MNTKLTKSKFSKTKLTKSKKFVKNVEKGFNYLIKDSSRILSPEAYSYLTDCEYEDIINDCKNFK